MMLDFMFIVVSLKQSSRLIYPKLEPNLEQRKTLRVSRHHL